MQVFLVFLNYMLVALRKNPPLVQFHTATETDRYADEGKQECKTLQRHSDKFKVAELQTKLTTDAANLKRRTAGHV